jgi:tetratricopeptide (TPR) repeat protein
MSPATSQDDGDDKAGLPLADLMQLDEACDRFEAACRAGQAPELAAFLADVRVADAARGPLLRELLALDVEYRRSRGERPDADAYRARFPEHSAIVDRVFTQLEPGARTRVASRSHTRLSGGSSVWPHTASMTDTQNAEGLPKAEITPEALDALRIAGYEILGELGRGGMGVVYLAHKVALNRRCALKMILAGGHGGAAVSARFRAEAETIARLRHPAIVQIYHVGEVGGLPYFELEYLSGGSLDRRLDGTPWSAPMAAGLVEVLAGAIAEAHRQGVVHRDLKPANILLDGDLRPKIADFGLAKMLDSDDGLTRTHTVLGSPSYMAPEQAEGHSRQVGPTTDVYALGAILYELLTGRPPFKAATAVETLVQVRDSDPVPPSRFQPGLPRAAEIICLKCLEKSPARRYPTAEALAEDLHRFRAGESILAHSAPAWEVAWRWTRRRPALAAAVGVGAAALGLLLGGVGYYNARLRAAADKARAAERSAVEQRNLALNAFNQLVFDVQERLGDSVATRGARRSLLHTAINGLDLIARSNAGAPPNLAKAIAHLKLGNIYRQIAVSAEARRQLEQAQHLAETLAAAAPGDLAVAECLRDALAGLGAIDTQLGRSASAKESLRRVVALSERILRSEPGRAGARQALIEAHFQLGRAHGFAGERALAEQSYRRMHDLAERWVDDEPGNRVALDLLASSYRKLADERKLVEDYDAARANYLKAIAINREVLAEEPGNVAFKHDLAIALDDLAGVEATQYHVEEALALFDEAQRIFAAQVEADPEDMDSQFRLQRTLSRAAGLERDEQRFARASEHYGQALERLLKLDRAGRLTGPSRAKERQFRELRDQIAACALGPSALDDLDAVRSRPLREACLLLPIRVRALAAQRRPDDVVAAATALCALPAATAEDLYGQARALGSCLRHLDDRRWAPADSPRWQALRRQCADRAVAALNLALERGFDDVRFIVFDETLAPLRGHPGYQKIADRLGQPSRSPGRAEIMFQ